MEFLRLLFNQGWIGTLIGFAGLVIAFVSLILYKASRIGARPVYQFQALRLIEKEERALPEEVEIHFKGRDVPRLTMTHVFLWNSGTATIDGKDIVIDDPLRLEFSEGAEVLRVRICKATREINKFKAMVNQNSPNEVVCHFDFLDAKDGVVIEVLHTAKERYPEVKGTIRGVPKGILDWGSLLSFWNHGLSMPLKNPRTALFATLLIGASMVAIGSFSPPETLFAITAFRWFILVFGLIYVSLSLLLLWLNRRRFPKYLMIEDFEE
jgi:hypothetical protein